MASVLRNYSSSSSTSTTSTTPSITFNNDAAAADAPPLNNNKNKKHQNVKNKKNPPLAQPLSSPASKTSRTTTNNTFYSKNRQPHYQKQRHPSSHIADLNSILNESTTTTTTMDDTNNNYNTNNNNSNTNSALNSYRDLLRSMVSSSSSSSSSNNNNNNNNNNIIITSSHVIQSILPIYYSMTSDQKTNEYQSLHQLIEAHFYSLLKNHRLTSEAHDLYYMAVRDFDILPSKHMTDSMIQTIINSSVSDVMGTGGMGVNSSSNSHNSGSSNSSSSVHQGMNMAGAPSIVNYNNNYNSNNNSSTLSFLSTSIIDDTFDDEEFIKLNQQMKQLNNKSAMDANNHHNHHPNRANNNNNNNNNTTNIHNNNSSSGSSSSSSSSSSTMTIGKRLKLFYKFTDTHRVPLSVQQYITLSNFVSVDGLVYLYDRVANQGGPSNHDAHIPPMTAKFLASVIQRCRKLRFLHRKLLLIFDQAKTQFKHVLDTEIYNMMIEHYCEIRGVNLAEELIVQMKRELGFEPSIYTYTSLLRGYQSIHHLNGCRRVLQRVLKQQAAQMSSSSNNAENTYSKKSPATAHPLQLDDQFMACYIYALSYHGRLKEAQQVLDQMESKYNVKPNYFCYRVLVTMYLNNNQYEPAKELMDKMEQLGMKFDGIIYKCLIKQRCQQGHLQDALDILDKVIKSGQLGSTSQFASLFIELVTECVNSGQLDSALQLTNRMERLGVKPTAKHVSLLINGFVKQYEKDQHLLSLPPDQNLEEEELRELLHPQLLHYHRQLQQQKEQQQYLQAQASGELKLSNPYRHHHHLQQQQHKQMNSLGMAQEFLLGMTSKYGHSVVSAQTLNTLLSASSKYNGIEKTEELAKSILHGSNEELNTRILIALIKQYAEHAPDKILPIFSDRVLISLHNFKQRFDFKTLYYSTLKILLDQEKYWIALRVFDTLTVIPALSQLIHQVVVDCEPQRRSIELGEQVESLLSSSGNTRSRIFDSDHSSTSFNHEKSGMVGGGSAASRSIFDSGDVQAYRQAPTIISYNHMLSCLTALDKYEELIEAFKLMEPYRITPNFTTYFLLLKALVAANMFETARNVISIQMKEVGMQRPPLVYNMLLRKYDVEFAQLILQDMQSDNIEPGVNTYQLLMETYFLNKMPSKVVECYYELREKTDMKPQPYIYSIVLRSLCTMRKVDEALQFFEQTKSYWLNFRYYSHSSRHSDFPHLEEDLVYSMIDGLCLVKRIDRAHQILDSYFQTRIDDDWERKLSATPATKSSRAKLYIPLIKYHLQFSRDFKAAERLLYDMEQKLGMPTSRFLLYIMAEGAKELGLATKADYYDQLFKSSLVGSTLSTGPSFYDSIRMAEALMFRAEREPNNMDREMFERQQNILFAKENEMDDQFIQIQNKKRTAAYNAIVGQLQQPSVGRSNRS